MTLTASKVQMNSMQSSDEQEKFTKQEFNGAPEKKENKKTKTKEKKKRNTKTK